jgi:undecaprenyl-diphosphatase
MLKLDQALSHWINSWSGQPVWDGLFSFLSFIGYGGAIWVVLALVLIMGAGRLPGLRGSTRWRAVGIATITALLLARAIEVLLKGVVARPRPPLTLTGVRVLGALPDSYSFPSGHALTSFAAATVLYLATHRTGRDGWAALLLAAGIALSRVYVGHHYVLDVVAGSVIGVAVGWIVWRLFESLFRLTPARHRRTLH